MTTPATTSVIIIDDHPLFRKGVSHLMALDDRLHLIGEASSGEEGLELARALEPDSDVRRAVAMEGLSDRDSKLLSLKKVLFGVWEMNWIAFNVGTDVVLPGRQNALPFLLLPQLESR